MIANRFSWKVAIALSLVGAASHLPGPALSQSLEGSQPVEYQRNEVDGTGISSLGTNFDPMQLIHNSNFSRSRNASEFAEDTRDSLNSAAEEFKRLQRQQLQGQPPAALPEMTPGN